jgi:putative SOS response-associated peptidase YedK
MCGRYTLTLGLDTLREAFPEVKFVEEIVPRYNIAPGQPIAAVPNLQPLKMEYFRWGLVPPWTKEPKIGYKFINARAETLAEKSTYKSPYKSRRCLVLADGFFEWVNIEGSKKKLPIYFRMKSRAAFAMAGLWEIWRPNTEDEIRSATIITTEPNKLVGKFHDRMPVILRREAYSAWLVPEQKSAEALQGLLRPYPGDELICYPVSPLANKAGNEGPEVIDPLREMRV